MQMQPELELLLTVQARDQALLDLDAQAASLDAAEAGLDAAVTRAEAAAAAARHAALVAEVQHGDVSARLDAAQREQERRRERLGRTLDSHEAATLRVDLDLGAHLLEVGRAAHADVRVRASELDARVGEAEAALAVLRAGQVAERARLAARREALEAEREEARAARDAVAAALPVPLRRRYERLWRARAPQAVVPLRNGACGACHTRLPLSASADARRGFLPEGCEACGVILYLDH